MTFRRRVILLTAAAVAIAIVLACVIVYTLVRSELRDGVDTELRRDASVTFGSPIFRRGVLAPLQIGGAAAHEGQERGRGEGRVDAGRAQDREPDRGGPDRSGDDGDQLVLPTAPLGGPTVYAQLVQADGKVVLPRRGVRLPGSEDAVAVAAGEREPFYSDAAVAGGPYRIYTAQVQPGQAIQVARPLGETDDALSELALILGAVSVGGVLLAAGLGVLVARASLVPVRRLSRVAREVAETRDLTRRIDPAGGRELAELAISFNKMLNALEDSLASQRQLVSDASHELRTPLASVRTNIDVLAQSDEMTLDQRRRLLADVVAQLDELTLVVADLVDLARDAEVSDGPAEPLRLDQLVEAAVDRARTLAPSIEFTLEARPCELRGFESSLEHALSNLLDNAVKWSPPDGSIEVAVSRGEVTVRDHGPGIAAEDMPHVFDRFYRSVSARGMPGSGLGLAIVRRIAEAHGGMVEVDAPAGGGARFRLRLPAVEVPVERAPQAV